MWRFNCPLTVHFGCFCAQFRPLSRRHAQTSRCCFPMHVCESISAIPGRSVRAGPIGRKILRPRKNCKNFGPKSVSNPTCLSMPTLRTVFGDLCDSWQDCSSPIDRDFGAISRDFGRKIVRPRKICKNFGLRSAANRTESHVPQLANAPQSA